MGLSAKEKLKVIKAFVEITYAVDMIDENITKVNGWTLDRVVEDWFEINDINRHHATRDSHVLTTKVISTSIEDVDKKDYLAGLLNNDIKSHDLTFQLSGKMSPMEIIKAANDLGLKLEWFDNMGTIKIYIVNPDKPNDEPIILIKCGLHEFIQNMFLLMKISDGN